MVATLVGGSHALKGFLPRVGRAARMVPALRQDPGVFWNLGSLSYQLILEKSPSE